MKDQDIVAMYWDRNQDALKYSEAQYGNYCMSISMNILHSHPDAEECVNDTWLKAWQAIPPQKPSVLQTFLGKITRHLSIDRYRTLHSAKRNVDLEIAMDELGNAIPMPDDTSEQTLCALIEEFLRSQPQLQTRLFLGRYWYGYKVATLAGHYGMSTNNVSQHLYQTRKKLKAFLEERGYSI